MGQKLIDRFVLPMHKSIVKFVHEIVNDFGQTKIKKKLILLYNYFSIKSSVYNIFNALFIYILYLFTRMRTSLLGKFSF